MLIKILNDDGSELYTYDTNKEVECVFPAKTDHARARGAILEAVMFLCGGKLPITRAW